MAILNEKSTVGGNQIMTVANGELKNYTESITMIEDEGVIDLNKGNVFVDVLRVSKTYSIINAKEDTAHSFTLQINTGIAKTLAFPASVKWQGGEIPDLTKSNKTYVLTFMTTDGGATWLGMFGGEF